MELNQDLPKRVLSCPGCALRKKPRRERGLVGTKSKSRGLPLDHDSSMSGMCDSLMKAEAYPQERLLNLTRVAKT